MSEKKDSKSKAGIFLAIGVVIANAIALTVLLNPEKTKQLNEKAKEAAEKLKNKANRVKDAMFS